MSYDDMELDFDFESEIDGLDMEDMKLLDEVTSVIKVDDKELEVVEAELSEAVDVEEEDEAIISETQVEEILHFELEEESTSVVKENSSKKDHSEWLSEKEKTAEYTQPSLF